MVGDEADEAVAARCGVSVDRVRTAREADLALREEVKAWLVDQILRGPGRSRAGGDVPRLGTPCPGALAEFHFCERFGFRILPRDLTPGSIDDQPADTFLTFAHMLSIEAETKERLELILQKKMGAKRK